MLCADKISLIMGSRNLLKWLAAAIALGLTLAPVGSAAGRLQRDRPCPVTSPASDTKFVPGQVWSFKGREFEPDATVTILKIETMPKIGRIIHVRLDGIRLRNCAAGSELTSLKHAPFTRDAIERSVGTLLRTGDVPAFEDGYAYWKAHCGGVYSITVPEMVVVDEKTLNSNSGCST